MKLSRAFPQLVPVLAAWLALAPVSLAPRAALAAPDDEAAAAPADAAPASGEGDAPAAPRKKKNRYKRSLHTSDESEGTADRRRLLMMAGEDKAVDVDFDTDQSKAISIGNPQVVAFTWVRLPGDKRQIVFKPLKAGETTVTVRDTEGKIKLIFNVRVTGSNLLRIAGELRSLLRDIEGVDIRVVGPKVVVDGEVLVPADYGRLFTVLEDAAYKAYVINLATLSPLALQAIAKKIQEDIQAFAPQVTARVVNGIIFLEGTVDNRNQADRAKQVAQFYLPEVRPGGQLDRDQNAQRMKDTMHPLIYSFIIINQPPPKKQEKLVRVTIHFVELDKDYNKFFGFQWQPGFTQSSKVNVGSGDNGGLTAQSSGIGATIDHLLPTLSAAQDAGYARIIKAGTMIVRSGQPASLEETTQIPFTVAGPNGTSTAAKTDVGLAVGVTPLILGQSEDIQLELKMQQNNAVGRVTAGVAPITSNHKVETRIYVKSGESAAVAGVTSSDVSTTFNKDNPDGGGFSNGTNALFNLKHTKGYTKKKSQFVIFVTPQIVENASDGTEDMKRNFRIKVK